jgi:hypothetical protein
LRSLARRPHLFPDNPPQRIFELRRFAFHVLPQCLVDERLVTRGPPDASASFRK